MSNVRSLFPGAMGPDSFVSCFDHLIPDSALKQKIILKGGPGVGKSTFMRRIHAALCAQGAASTLYVCSGDPDSLDAVAVEEAGVLLVDGTAPHIVDPHIPGARDSIINLGAFLDEEAMRPRLAPIRTCMQDHAAALRRAQTCMQAAHAFGRDNAALALCAQNTKRMAQMTRALIHAALDAEGESQEAPGVRPVITDAITARGEMCLIAEYMQPRVIRIAAHWAMDMTPVLRAVSHAARAAGYGVEEHICPYMPGRLLHLSIPSLHTLLTTSELPTAEQTFDFAACLPQSSLLRHEAALEQGRASIRLHIHRAVSALQQAKQLHDELERFYVPHMDFTRWQTQLDATLAALPVPQS